MIIQNGMIEFRITKGGGLNPETGYPVTPSSPSYSESIPCQFKANRYNSLGVVNGEHYTIARYEILIEEQPVQSEQIRLKDMSGKEIGTFSIIQVEPLEAVCQIRILV